LRAVEVAGTIKDFVISPQHWDRLAAEYARCGQHAQAYAMACHASTARIQVQRKESSDRAIAMAVRMDIDRSREEGERLRALASQAADRASLLQSNHDVLEQLGRLGQEITAQLDLDRVCERIQGHLRRLVGAPQVSIWLVDTASRSLRPSAGGAAEVPLDGNGASRPAGDAAIARCALGTGELLVDDLVQLDALSHRSGGVRMKTALLGPMRVRDACLGVVMIGSRHGNAYGERERLIFRTLCAYSAIALDNATAVRRLDRARQALQQSTDAERRARREAQHATQQRNHFLASVSRQLEAPLGRLHASLLGLAELPGAQAHAVTAPLLAQALRQSLGVTALASELIELARLESAAVQPVLESFSIAELAQDVILECAPLAQARGNGVMPQFEPGVSQVMADIAMIERVLASLLRQALLRCQAGRFLRLAIRAESDAVAVEFRVAAAVDAATVAPAGSNAEAPDECMDPSPNPFSLDLAIASQMLRMHGSELALRSDLDDAWVASFRLSGAAA
jgi:GAF domain-containing protein